MFGLATKKETAKEFNKISNKFEKQDREISKLKEKLENNLLKVATLEGAFSIITNNSHKSQVAISQNPKSSQAVSSNFETKLINRIKKSKRALIIAEMLKLADTHEVIEMFNIIVREKGLCSKATFYRYAESLRSQSLVEVENKISDK